MVKNLNPGNSDPHHTQHLRDRFHTGERGVGSESEVVL